LFVIGGFRSSLTDEIDAPLSCIQYM
jgi:hypothetical protein